MKQIIAKVTNQGQVTFIPSQKAEGGQLAKCVIRLRELGSSYADEYVCTMLGNLAQCEFHEGDVVAASLRFQVHEANGNLYQDIVVNDVIKLNNK